MLILEVKGIFLYVPAISLDLHNVVSSNPQNKRSFHYGIVSLQKLSKMKTALMQYRINLHPPNRIWPSVANRGSLSVLTLGISYIEPKLDHRGWIWTHRVRKFHLPALPPTLPSPSSCKGPRSPWGRRLAPFRRCTCWCWWLLSEKRPADPLRQFQWIAGYRSEGDLSIGKII